MAKLTRKQTSNIMEALSAVHDWRALLRETGGIPGSHAGALLDDLNLIVTRLREVLDE
jgi:hypothetical protein